jgi:hypothetical protein
VFCLEKVVAKVVIFDCFYLRGGTFGPITCETVEVLTIVDNSGVSGQRIWCVLFKYGIIYMIVHKRSDASDINLGCIKHFNSRPI